MEALRFARRPQDAVLTGVAAGLGARWGVDAMVVRIALALLTFAAGVGAVAYLVAWAVSLDPDDPAAPPAREPTAQQAVALGLVVVGLLVVFRAYGLWVGDAVGVPLVLAGMGAALLYIRTEPEVRPTWVRIGGRDLLVTRPPLVRLAAGGALVVVGMASLVAAQDDLRAVGSVVVAVLVTTAGLVVAFGPLLSRLLRQVSDERRERVRSQERAEVAAHLHDSVLQTLALIQRNAGDPRKMVTLARRQERELRSWLYSAAAPAARTELAALVTTTMEEVEDAHDVPVELVVVGDAAADDRMVALVRALREAAANAAVHSGAEEVSVYVECEDDAVTAYVRDRGRGFDISAVPADRRGIADSIRGRIERHGGKVEIVTATGEGCEVKLRMPRNGT
ncbi:MAG TPA: PspC domain-containing protein [Actinomycetota bacterium]|nr:PspC domain-containing protein [Actinomycetota bacterium]